MYSQRIRSVMEPKKLLLAAPDMTVAEAAKLMAKRNVGAVVVVEAKRVVGIFTERDAVRRVIARGLGARTTKLAKVMTPEPRTIDPNDTFGHALLVMHQNGFRHLPVIENDLPIGIVSSRSALDPDMEEFIAEAQRRIHIR